MRLRGVSISWECEISRKLLVVYAGRRLRLTEPSTRPMLAPFADREFLRKERCMPIEQHAPGLERIVDLHQGIEELARGFGGASGPAEGPVWWQEGGYLVFSDIGNNRRMQWSPGAGVTLRQEPTNEANGLTRDRQGRLVACEHLARRVTRQDPDGNITVVANRYHGRRLNRPNDVVVKSDGSIYFTDPGLGRIESELDFCGGIASRQTWATSMCSCGISWCRMGLPFPQTNGFSTSTTRAGGIFGPSMSSRRACWRWRQIASLPPCRTTASVSPTA